MKKMTLGLLMTLSCFCTLNAFAADPQQPNDLKSSKDFVATCPEQYLTYIDKSEGGPGPYCACPDENISYLDKAEGGPGFYCAP